LLTVTVLDCTRLDKLKQRLNEQWAQLSEKTVNKAIYQWRCPLQACVKAEDGRLEQKF